MNRSGGDMYHDAAKVASSFSRKNTIFVVLENGRMFKRARNGSWSEIECVPGSYAAKERRHRRPDREE